MSFEGVFIQHYHKRNSVFHSVDCCFASSSSSGYPHYCSVCYWVLQPRLPSNQAPSYHCRQVRIKVLFSSNSNFLKKWPSRPHFKTRPFEPILKQAIGASDFVELKHSLWITLRALSYTRRRHTHDGVIYTTASYIRRRHKLDTFERELAIELTSSKY